MILTQCAVIYFQFESPSKSYSMEMIRINLEYDSPYAYYKIRFEFSDIPFIFHNFLFLNYYQSFIFNIFVFYAIISSNSVYVNKFIV